MVNKLLFELAEDRPLWNYLGTFQDKDLSRLVSPERISMNVSTAFACGARPGSSTTGFLRLRRRTDRP